MKSILVPLIVLMSFLPGEKNEADESNRFESALVQRRDHHDPITDSFIFQANGPFNILPVSATIVKIEQEMSFSSSSPFKFIGGQVQGFDDLTISTFPDRFFDGKFKFFGKGNDTLFATVTVQTSVFSDPINPEAGDFIGSEDFTGTFQVTGGTGRFIRAKGNGTYTAHSEWRPPVTTGTLFSGSTKVNGTGIITGVAGNWK
jgi:hypothetical protein